MPPRHAFLLGAAKAGSTTLARMLETHPSICLSTPKEPLFFELDEEYERGLDFYWEQYFAPVWAGEPVVLDARLNLFLPYVPERIAGHFPDAPCSSFSATPRAALTRRGCTGGRDGAG